MTDEATRAAIEHALDRIHENAANPQPDPAKDMARHCVDLVLIGTQDANTALKQIVGQGWGEKLIKLTAPQRKALADPNVEPFAQQLNTQRFRLTRIILLKLASIRCTQATELLSAQAPSREREQLMNTLNHHLVKLARERDRDWASLKGYLADINREMAALRVGAVAEQPAPAPVRDDEIELDEDVVGEVRSSIAQALNAVRMGRL